MSSLVDQLTRVGLVEQRRRSVPVSRASFELTDRNAFDDAIALAAAWMADTARAKLPEEAHKGRDFEFIDSRGHAVASALRMDDGNGAIWAARISYYGDKTAERGWTTDLFVEQRKGAVVRFGSQLTCEHGAQDPGFDHSRPRVIKNLLQRLSAEADGEILNNEVEAVDYGAVDDLVDLIYLSNRRLPVVLVSTDDYGGSQVDLLQLANRLSGTAHLRCLGVEASYELTRSLAKRMSTFDGAVRVYMPGVEAGAENPFEHPLWLAPPSGLNPKLLGQVASRVLPLGFRDAEGDARFWRVGLLRQAVTRAAANANSGSQEEKLTAEIEALRSERDALKEDVQSAENLMHEESDKLGQLQIDHAKLKEEIFSLREQVRGVKSAGFGSNQPLSYDQLDEIIERNPNVSSSLRMIASVFPDRVVVLESAYQSAEDSYSFSQRWKAFELLWSLSTTYWTALSSGQGDFEARKCFGSSYAAKESDTLSTSGRSRRTFEYEGQSILMEKHLKIGVADNKSDTLRVHFEWLADKQLIVIGHCGGHLNF